MIYISPILKKKNIIWSIKRKKTKHCLLSLVWMCFLYFKQQGLSKEIW